MSAVFNFTFVPWFRSVAPYIHMHRGKTFVVGIAGEAIAAGKLQNLAQDLALIQSMGVKIVLVHGFRPQVNEQLAAKGHTPKYSHGMRITDSVSLDCAQEAAGQLRYEIEAAFSQGLPNTPMAGSTVRVISGNFITARPVGIVDGVDFMHSGLVRKVDVDGIMRTLDMGAMVLLSPFGFSPTGEAFNLTMEEVATSVAAELQADKLIFLTEVPGIRIDPHAPASDDNPIDTELPLAAAKKLLAECTIQYDFVDVDLLEGDERKAILEDVGSSMSMVLKCSIHMTRPEYFSDMNRVYASYFKKEDGYPARVTTFGSEIYDGLDVEIDVIAGIDE